MMSELVMDALQALLNLLLIFVLYFPDNHDVISLKVYDIETNRPSDDNTDYRKIKPSADFFASPRGEKYF